MKEERIFILSAGVRLEGLLNIQEASSLSGGVLLCHPHPQYGGDMDHPVVTTAAETASQEGFSTLRFNFRGVGQSEGFYGEGVGELEDVKAAAAALFAKLVNKNPFLILAGYSFGSWVGSRAATEDERFKGVVAIAPPLDIYEFDSLKESNKEKLFIAGDRDNYCPLPLLERWYQGVMKPKSIAVIPGADHFFLFHTQYLIPPLKEFFRRIRESNL